MSSLRIRSQTTLTKAQYIRRSYTTPTVGSRDPLKLAIIGSGPSGFYTASRILSSVPPSAGGHGRGGEQDVEVHMYERLPTPYGLVRYGVAPDHPEVKNCQHKFDELSSDPRFSFFGNVSIGTQPSSDPSTPSPPTTLSSYSYPHAVHIPLSSLLPHYNTLILTYGASLSNSLASVPGSSSSSRPLHGVFPALALVGWYNGHPAFAHLTDQVATTLSAGSARDVLIVGQGNVALDVARMLLKPVDQLAETDLPTSVLEVLAQSKVKEVSVVGRRGPGQVAFTPKEFREMLNLPGVSYGGIQPDLLGGARKAVEGDRMKKRLLGLMEKPNGTEGDKVFRLDFLKSPKAFLQDENLTSSNPRVGGVEWTINELLTPPATPPAPPSQEPAVSSQTTIVARPTGQTVTTKAGMVVESVGYRTEPLGGGEEWQIPFDTSKGRVRNIGGRVVDESGTVIPGMYAAGWAARGPVGVIASTMHDAYALASTILEDHYATSRLGGEGTGPLSEVPEKGLPEEVEKGLRDGTVVDLKRWKKIDEAEVSRARGGKEREKFTNVQDMLEVL